MKKNLKRTHTALMICLYIYIYFILLLYYKLEYYYNNKTILYINNLLQNIAYALYKGGIFNSIYIYIQKKKTIKTAPK